jgi:signal transduction histidine kinase
MKFYQSIRFRIVAYTLLSATLLVTLNAGITFFITGKNISRLVENLLSTEVDYFKYRYSMDSETPLPNSKYIKVYRGIESVPGQFRDIVKDLPEGIHWLHDIKHGPPVHIAMLRLPDRATPYYMFFHAHEFIEENSHLNPHQILLILIALLLIPGIIIGYLSARMLFAPVVTLMDKIRSLNPEDIPEQLSERRYTNEIGMLTSTIESTMNRIKKFIQREKEFTRDASHELRTPLTIIKGAMEIMEQQPEMEINPFLKKPLKRAVQSIHDMETTIETFLWLAREEPESAETCQVEPVVRRAVENSRHMIENKDLSVKIDVKHDKIVRIREEVLYIAITNLVRNAFYFTAKGSVTITIESSFIEIRDTGTGIAREQIGSVTLSHIKGEDSPGFGLGLSIVTRLCGRFGWKLTIESQPGRGTCVRIVWNNL